MLIATVALALAQAISPPPYDFERLVAVLLFLFTALVAAPACWLDAYLARSFAIPLRAPLIAAAGAVLAPSLASGFAWMQFGSFWLPSAFLSCFAIGGAVCAGTCSLLANDYGSRETAAGAKDLLRN
ncbi:hypothetical protein [Bradyrhizobium liaoningense]|uniref:hypothetical protein n=1 Tax=Bradyrhizobium liaoningense TaxID=43992 RepID=UPI001BA4A485|nr:hypothetical protein [Bradyrhizobium liaoningense]MBR0717727.1 hypothetical protein [Bradyrhizobium liaoningense]